MAKREITLTIRVNDKELDATSRRLNAQSKSISDTGSGFDLMSAKVAGATAAIAVFTAVFTKALDITKEFILSSIEAASAFEKTKNALTAVSGNAKIASDELAALDKLAENTAGLGLETAEKGYLNLRAVGFEAQRARDFLEGLSKVKILSGGTQDDLEAVLYNLTQIKAQGKLTGDELKESLGRLPALAPVIERAFGTVNTKAIAELGLSSDQFFDKLVEGLKETQSASGGTEDAWQKLNDEWLRAKRNFGEAVAPEVAKSLVQLTEILKENRNTFKEYGEAFADFLRGVKVVGNEVLPVLKEIVFALIAFAEYQTKGLVGTNLTEVYNKYKELKSQTSSLSQTAEVSGSAFAKYSKDLLNSAEAAERTKKAQETLKKTIDDLTSRIAFFGQNSEVAAVKQKLINEGIYDFTTGLGLQAVQLAAVIDRLKAAQTSQEEYNTKLKSASDELKELRQNAEFQLRFPNSTELDRFNNQVQQGAFNFNSLSGEIDRTREALKNLQIVRAAMERDKNLYDLRDDLQKTLRGMGGEVDAFTAKTRAIAESFNLKGFKESGLVNLDVTVEFFSYKVKTLTDRLIELGEFGNGVADTRKEFVLFLQSFKTPEGLQVFADDAIPNLIELFIRFRKATKAAAEAEGLKTFNAAISDADERIRELNIQLGRAAELTEVDRTQKLLLTDAYKTLTDAQKQQLLAKAAEIDALEQTIEAQRKYEEAFNRTVDVFEDALTRLADGDWKGFFEGIFQELKRFLVRAAAEFLASKFFKLITGNLSGSGQSSGGGIGGFFNQLFNLGNSGGGFGGFGTPPFNPNINFSNSGSGNGAGAGSIWGGWLNIKKQAADFRNAGNANGRLGVAGGIALAGTGASIIGGLVGGRAGSFISNIGMGAALGAQIGSIVPGIGTAIGAVIGAAGGFLASLFGGDPKRKRDKKEKIPQLNQGFLDATKQFTELIQQVNFLQIDPDSALAEGKKIREQITSGFGIQFESKKYRKISQDRIRQELAKIDAEPDGLYAQLKKAVEIARGAADRSKRILPEFASGGYIADFFKPNGLIPGVFDSKDNLLSLLSKGEMVLNPYQQNRIRSAAGFDVFATANIPNYPNANPSPKKAMGGIVGGSIKVQSPNVIVQPNFTLYAEGVTFDERAQMWMESDDGKRTQVNVIKKLKKSGDIT